MMFLVTKELDATVRIIRNLCASLCKVIYQIIAWAYQLFMDVSSFKILTADDTQGIYQRVTMILAIVMVFYVSFEFVKYIVSPDAMTDKEKGAGKLAYKMILVVVLIAFVPKIFTLAYKVQDVVINNQIISKVILGKTNINADHFGKGFASNVLNVFYYYDNEMWEDNDCDGFPCDGIVQANLSTLATTGKLPSIHAGLNASGKTTILVGDSEEEIQAAKINFDGFIAVAVGAVIAYMLILYCVDAGVRVVQLVFLQVIAPIPIIGYLAPKKDGIFQKWCKQCLTTYLDLFIRLSIINFVLLVCQTLLNSSSFGDFGSSRRWVQIALIMGLLLFAKKAPKMLQELFPSSGAASGNFGLKAGERIAPGTAKAVGMALGASKGLGSLARRGIRGVRQRQKLLEDKKNNPLGEARDNLANSRNRLKKMHQAPGRLVNAERTQDEDYKRTMAAKNAFEDAYFKRTGKKYKHGGTNDNLTEEEQRLKGNWEKEKTRFAASTKEKNQLREDLGMKAAAPLSVQRATKNSNISEAKQNVQDLMPEYQKANEKYRETEQNYQTSSEKYNSASQKVEQLKAEGKEGTPEFVTAQQELTSAYNEMKSAEVEKDTAEAQMNTERNKVLNRVQDYNQTRNSVVSAQEQFEREQREKLTKGEISSEQYEESIGRTSQIKTIEKEAQEKAPKKIEELEQEVTLAEEQFSKAQNIASQTSIPGIVTSTVLGSLATTAKGIYQGAQANNLKEAIEKTKKVKAEDIKAVKAVEKYYEDGGTGYIDRQVQKFLKDQGIPTKYEEIQSEIKSLSDKAKSTESLASMEGDAKAKVDAVEDRLKEKIKENKMTIAETGLINTGVVDENGNKVLLNVTAGQRHSQIMENEETKLNQLEAEQASLTNKLATATVGSADYNRMKKEQEEKAREITRQKQIVSLLPKYLAREQFTQIMKSANPEGDSNFDQVAVQKWRDLEAYFNTARTNPDTVSKLGARLNNPTLYNKFITGQYSEMTFDDADEIKTALINISNERKREVTALKEQQRQKEASTVTDAAKAADDFAGNSGK